MRREGLPQIEDRLSSVFSRRASIFFLGGSPRASSSFWRELRGAFLQGRGAADVVDDRLRLSAGPYPSFFSARGTDWFTILNEPPPDNFLNLMSAKSGSTPVVSQSISRPMVPVGASTVACALR